MTDTELGSLVREIHVEAPAEVVFEVISSPEHLTQWWPDSASYDPIPGSSGEISFGTGPDAKVQQFTVLEVDPPRTFTFRWTHPAGERAAEGNSLLVTFTLRPDGDGTWVRMEETGFRELGWEVAQLEELYRDHVVGWDYYIPKLPTYVAGMDLT